MVVYRLFTFLTAKSPPPHSRPVALILGIIQEIRSMDDITYLSLLLMGVALFTTFALGLFSQRKLTRKMDSTEMTVANTREKLQNKETFQMFLYYVMDMSRRAEENMNMALYMSEMRRKARAHRPKRPARIEDRSPGFLPNLRAERVVKDGIAILDISEDCREEEDILYPGSEEDVGDFGTPKRKRRLHTV